MSKFKVILHKWIEGKLHHKEHTFENRQQAEEFAVDNDHHVAKVYNPQGSMINEVVKDPVAVNTYA
jgi:hypothetical protein